MRLTCLLVAALVSAIATMGYKEIFERVVAGSAWAAFGFIAAEADLQRMEDPSS